MSTATSPDPVLSICHASALSHKDIRWFWQNRMAFGKLTLIDGDGNEGKSFVSLDLAARFSTGRPMPDGTPSPGVGNVLVIQDEDGAEDTVYPRLVALGADLDRVSILTASIDDEQPFCIPSQLAALDRAIRAADARFIIIDPMLAFLDAGVMANSEQSIRRAFRPLRRLARDRDCVILMIRHLAKGGRGRALYRGLGSVALTNVCRSAWLVGRDPYDKERRVFAELKGNLADAQPSLAYRIRGEGASATIEWIGETGLTADQLVGAHASPQLDRACEFLNEFLKDGPRLLSDIRAAGRARRISERTLVRARKHLGARSRRMYRAGALFTYWLMPGQIIPFAADGTLDEADQFLADREKARLSQQTRGNG